MLSLVKRNIHFIVILIFNSSISHAQWMQTNLQNGISADRIITFNNGLYMPVNNYGIYKSLDEGDTWVKTGPVGTFRIVKHKNQLLAFTPGTLYKSSDGVTWVDIAAPAGLFFWDVASDNTSILLIALNGIYLSDNDGASWTNVGGGVPTIGDFRSIAIKGSDFYVGGFNGKLYKSSNHGLSWAPITLQVAYAVKQIVATPNTLFLNVEQDGLLRSRDDGVTWENVAKNDLTLSGEYLHQIYVDGSTVYAAAASNHVYLSMDEGTHWVLVKSKTNWFNITALVTTGSHFFMITLGGGVFRNSKLIDSMWEVKNNGLYFTDVYDIVVKENNEIFAGTERTFVQSSKNEADSWNQLQDMFGFSGQNARSLLLYKNYLFSGSGGGGIQRSEDGTKWIGLNLGLVSRIIYGMAATNEYIFAGTDDGIYRSSDLGELWKKSNEGIQGGIKTVYASGNNVFAGTYSGLFFSSDQGVTWKKISSGLTNESVVKVLQVASDIYVSVQTGGVFKTSNLGESWKQVYSGYGSCLAEHQGIIFIGSTGGTLVMSYDKGDSWVQVGGLLPQGYIQAISFTRNYVLTGLYQYGTGIWRRRIGELIPPTLVYSTRKDNSNFYVGESFKIASDQTLRGLGGVVLTNSTVKDYILIKDSKNQNVNFSAKVDPTAKSIEVTVEAKAGENYTSTVKFENEFGLAIKNATHGFTAISNNSPSVTDDQLVIFMNTSYNFSGSDFMRSYKDDHDELISIVVKSVPTHGQLMLNGTQRKIGDEIGKENLAGLTYLPEPQFIGIDKFTWNGFDGQYYSTADATMTIEVATVTDVEDQQSDHLLIYPNPFSDEISVKFKSKEYESYEIRISNGLGEKIKTLSFTSSDFERNLSVKELAAGIYFIEVIAPNFGARKMIIKR